MIRWYNHWLNRNFLIAFNSLYYMSHFYILLFFSYTWSSRQFIPITYPYIYIGFDINPLLSRDLPLESSPSPLWRHKTTPSVSAIQLWYSKVQCSLARQLWYAPRNYVYMCSSTAITKMNLRKWREQMILILVRKYILYISLGYLVNKYM